MKNYLALILMTGIIFLSYCAYKVGYSVGKYELGVPQLQKRYVKMHGVDTNKLEYILENRNKVIITTSVMTLHILHVIVNVNVMV